MEVKTFLRLRPVQQLSKAGYEVSEDSRTILIKEVLTQGLNRRKSIMGPPSDTEFTFDQIFNIESTQVTSSSFILLQIEIYKKTVQPLIQEAMSKSVQSGIVAHGENQTGKSYSIFGVENIQQEEFSIDQEDPKDSRGIVLKAIHYIIKRAKSEGRPIILECQMLDIYLDTIRDLSKGKTNKFGRMSQVHQNNLDFAREKDVEIEELMNGDIKLNNIQSIKLSSTKEAANFIEKCVSFRASYYFESNQFLVGLLEETRE